MNPAREDGGLSSASSASRNTKDSQIDLNCAILEPSDESSVYTPYREPSDEMNSLESEESNENLNFSFSPGKTMTLNRPSTNKHRPYNDDLESTINKLAILSVRSQEDSKDTWGFPGETSILAGQMATCDFSRDSLESSELQKKASENDLTKSIDLDKTVDLTESSTLGNKTMKTSFTKENTENIDPQLGVRNTKTAVLSIQSLRHPNRLLKSSQTSSAHLEMATKTRDDNFNIENNLTDSNLTRAHDFDSTVSESITKILANIKTPKVMAMRFFEDRYASSPKVGVLHDTDSIDVSRISNNFQDISVDKAAATEKSTGRVEYYHHSPTKITSEENSCRANDPDMLSILTTLNDSLNSPTKGDDQKNKELMKRLSQEYIESPKRFTDRLITIIEESHIHSKQGKDITGVNLSRITEEFRKICIAKNIEDETMPKDSWLLNEKTANESILTDSARRRSLTKTTPVLCSQDPSTSKRIYPRTPRRIFNKHATNCGTSNCKNPSHRISKNPEQGIVPTTSPCFPGDSTLSFIHLENECNQFSQDNGGSPMKKLVEVSREEDSHQATLDKIMKIGDRQMASLDNSGADVAESETSESQQSPEEPDSVAETAVEGSYERQLHMYQDQLEKSLMIELAEKRQRCFDTAKKMYEIRSDPAVTKAMKSLEKYPELIAQNDPLTSDNRGAAFLSTLSVCTEYHEYITSNSTAFQTILQSSFHHKTDHSGYDLSKTLQKAWIKSTPKFRTSLTLNVDKMYANKNILPSSSNISKSPKTPGIRSKRLESQYGCAGILKSPSTSSGRSSRKSPKASDSSVDTSSIKTVSSLRKMFLEKAMIKSGKSPMRSVATNKPLSKTPVKRTTKLTKPSSLETIQTNRSPSPGRSKNRVSIKLGKPGISTFSRAKVSPRRSPLPPVQRKISKVPSVTVTRPTPNKSSPLCSNVLEGTPTKAYTPRKATGTIKKTYCTPTLVRKKPKCYFPGLAETPTRELPPNVMNSPHAKGLYRLNYNTVLSPVGMYINGTDVSLIRNIKGNTNEMLLTPRSKKTPKTPVETSPILARSPRMAEVPQKSYPLKFRLSPQHQQKQKKPSEVSDAGTSEIAGPSEYTIKHVNDFALPVIAYEAAPQVHLLKESPEPGRELLQRGFPQSTDEKIIIRHAGRYKYNGSPFAEKASRSPDDSLIEDILRTSPDVSVQIQKAAKKTNFVGQKKVS